MDKNFVDENWDEESPSKTMTRSAGAHDAKQNTKQPQPQPYIGNVRADADWLEADFDD